MKKLAVIVGHGSDKKVDGKIVQDKGCVVTFPEYKYPFSGIFLERDIIFWFGQVLCENIFEDVTMRGERLNLLFLSKEGKETEKDIVKQVNKFNPDLAIELHANAFEGGKASGSEILISYYRDMQGIWIDDFVKGISRTLGIRNRFIKYIKKGDRGWYFLSKTKCLSIITEPFFLDNKSDYEAYLNNRDKLIMEFTRHILDYLYGG